MSKIFHDIENKRIDFLDERFYLASDNGFEIYYPSVTHILDTTYPKGAGFFKYLKRNGMDADKILEEAGQSGSKIHDAIDRYIKGETVHWDDLVYSLDEWKQILKAIEFFEKFNPEVMENEVSITNDTHKLGGTIDLVCKLNGDIWLIDYKSSNAIYKTHELQIAAYAIMWNEVFPDKMIKYTGILHTKADTRGEDKKGKSVQGKGWKLITFDRSYEDAFRIFKHAHAIFNEENPNPKPLNKVYPDFIKREETNGINT